MKLITTIDNGTNSILIPRKAAKRIESIFEWECGVYSIQLKDSEGTVWVNSKVELYDFLRTL